MYAVGVGDDYRLQRPPGIYLDHRKIGLAVGADDPRPVFHGVAVHFYLDAVDAVHHVIIGNDVAVLVDDEACAGLFAALRLR